MEPAPVGVNHNLALRGRAAAPRSALGPADLGVRLGLLRAGLLRGGHAQDGEKSKSMHGAGVSELRMAFGCSCLVS